MAIKAFATVDDYVAAYGAVADEKQLETLLMRATGYLLAKMDGYEEGYDEVLDLNLWQRNMFAVRCEFEVGFIVRDVNDFVRIDNGVAA